ncbi:hypothetical protein [Actinomadura geliboluensis]|uniref:DUF5343 domain-containing protein n=1 Tax=Actinomadura geliboluensis TaxID=882440 RepID=A0A5S4GXH1_9ACTN|nr:hypothetical protein [Actinomadura geliboluensis]TMR37392.1 hypothetical protein ETD96_18720 [Actinomadura geliboluensis]
MADDGMAEESKAPYISYETLTNFIDNKLGGAMIPPRIDRGFLDTYAGSVQAQLLAALRTMRLISAETGEVLAALREAARSPEERRQVIGEWARQFYAPQIELAEANATAQMLHESFSANGYTGSTLRKAVVFYLAVTEDVGLPKSPFFKPPRQSGSTSPSRRRKPSPASPPIAPSPPSNADRGKGEQKTISFGPAGQVTITVDVRWLDLPDDIFQGLRKVVRDLEALQLEPAAVQDEPQPADPPP